MVVKVSLQMKDGSFQKARVTDCETVEEAIEFMKEMRPGVVEVFEGWDRAELWERQAP
ncbi:hypothetical protein [Tumebacillus permanentifrigoris]|uniref:Uncharacterized protein n=1 Tax=Tumebacillus permanentifrigoris TaxID=378543 RepID=A0A316D7E1_9BACL|nr:hypothetical protein [Tumebacillus permanentifrigoris]PWK11577.1 hypothetical protein C7459_110106 [Tumebacillus permanentifrigoris]